MIVFFKSTENKFFYDWVKRMPKKYIYVIIEEKDLSLLSGVIKQKEFKKGTVLVLYNDQEKKIQRKSFL